MKKPTKKEFEELLDRLYAANDALREGRLSLPRRLNAVAEHLFMYPERGTEQERQVVRGQLFSLESKGTFDFRRTR